MSVSLLVCFAVKEEARHFRMAGPGRILVTGMGQPAARVALEQALLEERPGLVLTCGFAGGLNPALRSGAVIFDASDESQADLLRTLGATAARFHCAPRVVVTRAEKAALRLQTRADAVEMESGVIRQMCVERGIPSATVRVISDAADEDLPIDFNELITPEGTLRLGSLIARLLRRPNRIPGLLDLQCKTAAAARALGRCLEELVSRRNAT